MNRFPTGTGSVLARWLIILLFVLALGANAGAYMSEIKVLSTDEISHLSDDKLVSTYIDLMVEIKAAESFHTTSGYSPKEYENFKELLRYKIIMLQEFDKRKLPTPRTE